MPPSGRGGRKLAKIREEDNDEDTEGLTRAEENPKRAQPTTAPEAQAAQTAVRPAPCWSMPHQSVVRRPALLRQISLPRQG